MNVKFQLEAVELKVQESQHNPEFKELSLNNKRGAFSASFMLDLASFIMYAM